MAMGKLYLATPAKAKKKRTKRQKVVVMAVPKRVVPKQFGFGMKSAVVKMRYRVPITFTSPGGVGVPIQHIFRANSTYDPDLTGVGIQPHLHDQAYTYFNHGTCLGSKITVSGTNSQNTKDFVVVLGVNDDAPAPETFTEALQNQLEHHKTVVGGNKTGVQWKISHSFSAQKFFGKSKESLIGSADYREGPSSYPNELAYFTFQIYSLDGSALSTVYGLLDIEYYMVMTEPKAIGLS